MSPPAYAAALQFPAATVAVSSFTEVVSLAGVAALDAAVLASLVRSHGALARSGRKLQVVNAAPAVSRMMRQLGLAWMLDGRQVRDVPAANQPMSNAA
jgi:anti-anti-sigma regulatory factor